MSNTMNSQIESMLTPTEVLEHLWCPRFTWFMNVQNIPQHEERRYKVLKGKEIHHRREIENKFYFRRKIGVVNKQNNVYLGSPKLRLRGIVDEVLWLKDGTMAPLDYKYTLASEHDVVFKTHQIQIRIYALLIREIYNREVNKGFVAYIRGHQKLYEVPVLAEDFKEIEKILDEIFMIVKSGQIPRRAPNRNHCIDCCYRNICV